MSKLNKITNAVTFVPLKVEDEPKCSMLEIINAEKQLWSLVYSKGILHKDAWDLYRQVCSGYEKIILGDHEESEFQEIEYSLWKLHYKHIHEFRKGVGQSSTSSGHKESEIDRHVRYKSFLMEASEFYQNLISKTRKLYGLGQDPLLEEKGGVPCDPVKLHICRYTCHRFLVCLGDLARYEELCKNNNVQRHSWSVAATYYFKAASTWPDSGNPQNQLAVLAKYIGDDFLALYHCIRSIAVKEPFPDAWNNLNLLLEENRSIHLDSLSRGALFNFSNPFERSDSPVKSSASDMKYNEMQTNDHTSPANNCFWSLFVRMISLFFVEASSEEFPYTFTSTMREWEFLLASNDIKLSGALESYQQMDSNRTGPYRALQLVSIIIFVVDSLTTTFHQESKDNTNPQQPNLVKSALTATFIILGRLTERCLKDNLVKFAPFLPAVLVFVEWLIGTLDIVMRYVFQEEVACAVSYFLDTFVQLLNHLKAEGEFKHQKDIALWEDIEFRGFSPLASSHKLLNFRTREGLGSEFVDGNTRGQRILDAAMKIVQKSPKCFRKWIFYDFEREKFFTVEQPSSVDLDLEEPQTSCEAITEKENITKIVTMDEEEEIIFNPLARYNSAPIYSPDIDTSTKETKDKTVPSDDSLRRATSLLAGQIQNFHSDSKSFNKNHPLVKHETNLNASASPYPLGPPSLDAWVLDKESINTQKEKAAMDFFKPRLSPIHEMCSLSLIEAPIYSPPILSGQGLLNDASLLRENSATHNTNNLGNVGVSPRTSTSTFTNRPALYGPSSFTPMSSSEWLQQFRNQNLNRGYMQPIHCYRSENVYSHDESRFGLIDRGGVNPSNSNQIMYPNVSKLYADSQLGFLADGSGKDNLFHNYQGLNTYGYAGDMLETKGKQPSLHQYLEEKEWQLQNQAQMRGPAYMGN